jgi:membrane protein implicated in regulation of membrane protease activity
MTVDIANSLYVLIVAVGGLLLILSIVLDDYLDRSLDRLRLRFELGGASFVQLLLAFLAGFGLGGLIGTLLLHVGVSTSAVVGIVVGLITAALTVAMFEFTRRRGKGPGFDLEDLVGRRGLVAAAIAPPEAGSVSVTYAGIAQQHAATSDEDIAEGVTVMVTDATSASLVVVPVVDHGSDTPVEG